VDVVPAFAAGAPGAAPALPVVEDPEVLAAAPVVAAIAPPFDPLLCAAADPAADGADPAAGTDDDA
jgi:hypothetical protein